MAEDLLRFLQREHDEGWLSPDPMTELSIGFLEHLEGYIEAVCADRQDQARDAGEEG